MREASEYYVGDSGKEYALGQRHNETDHLGSLLQSRHFVPFLTGDMQVLDFGCGNGAITKKLERHVASIEGVEVNEFTRKMAAERLGLRVWSSLKEIPEETRFDAIVSNHVLEHIPRVYDVLRELGLLLKPDGRLLAIVPMEDFRAKEQGEWSKGDRNHHLFTWTPLTFANLLRESGYRPQQIMILSSAWSFRLLFLGDGLLQRIACYLTAFIRRRRQLMAVAAFGGEG